MPQKTYRQRRFQRILPTDFAIEPERRDCVIGNDFLYFFKGDALTHVIQKMTLLDVEETEFGKKLYQYRKTDGKKGKDQLVKFKEFQRDGEKYYLIDKGVLEDDQIYYLAERLGEHDGLSQQRQFYYTNGRLFEIYDLKDVHFEVRERYRILQNEKEELERLRNIPGIRKQLEKDAKISKSLKNARRPAKEKDAIGKLEQILAVLPLNKSPLEIIGRLTKEKMREIVANRHRLDDCWIGGVLDKESSLIFVLSLGDITKEDIDWTAIDANPFDKMKDGQEIDEKLSKKRRLKGYPEEDGEEETIWKFVKSGDISEDEAKRLIKGMRMDNE